MARKRLIRKPPSISKRGNRWFVDYYDSTGKRQRKGFALKSEAEKQKRWIIKNRFTDSLPTAINRVEIKYAMKRYFDLVSIKKVAVNEDKRNISRLADFLCGDLMLVFLDEVKPDHIREYQLRRSQFVSHSTVNREFSTLSHMFNSCVEWEYIKRSPCHCLKRLPSEPKKRLVMTEDRYLKILGELNVQMRNALIFMAETGCRNIEFRKLKWSDVDLERETVKLTSQKGKGGSASSRTIPLSQMIVKILAQIRENSSSDYVFPGRTGGVQSKGALALAVRRARQRLGIGEPVSPYGLRHRMATELAKKNLEVARIVLGHSSIETTQGYLHIADDTVKNELESISIYNQSVTGQPNNDFLLH